MYNQLLEGLTGVTAENFSKEYNSLSNFVRSNIEGGARGYVATRNALLNTFGSTAKINEYYTSMVAADFPSATSTVRGHSTRVHPTLKERLKRAADVLKSHKVGEKTGLDITEAGISGIGGFNIRENRNNPSSLSNHSFGWAIDIDATINPNVGPASFPKTLVESFTGQDIYKGEAAKEIRTGGTVEELLPHARTLRETSDLFKQSFDNEASFKSTVASYLSSKGLGITGEQINTLFDLLKKGNKANRFNKKEMEAWLSAKAPKTEPAAVKPSTSGRPGTGATAWSEAPSVANLLIEAYQLFQGTTTKKGKKIEPSTIGTPRTIAAHGFLNLPAELIAALTGSDGASLKWLGAIERGTKDFMHFELKTSDQPRLPKEEVKPAMTGDK